MATANDIATRYPMFAGLASIPEIQALLNDPAMDNASADVFAAKLHETNWWKTNSESNRKITALQLADPAEYNAQYIKALQMVQNIERQEGIGSSPEQQSADAKFAMWSGMDEGLLRQQLIQRAPAGDRALKGDLDVTWSKIRGLAADYGVNVSDQWAYEQAQNVQGRGMTLDGVTEYMKQQARVQYQHLDKQINEGFTVKQIAEPYIQTAAQLLEVNPDSISLTDPRWQRAISEKTADGKGTQVMSMQDWQKTVMSDPGYGWDRTMNAKQTAYSMRDQLAQTFGVR